MKFTNKNILAIKKRGRITTIIGVVLIILSIVLISLSANQNEKDEQNIKYLNELIESNDRKTGEKAYLNINWLSSKFAVYNDTTDAYYFAYDGDYYYIIYMTESKASELLNMDLENNPVEITGVTRSISDDVRDIAIEDYNSELEDNEEALTTSNFYNIFGDIYLDQTSTYSTTTDMYSAFGILIFFFGLITTLVGIISSISVSSRMKKISDVDIQILESEMNNSESFYYDKVKLYLTPNYIIMVDGRLLYYKYSDILWMYSYESRYNGFRTNKAIKILTNDAKTSMFANTPLATKQGKAIYDEIWDTIVSKNPNMKLGYTTENIKYFNGVIKEIKNKKKNGTKN